MTIKETLAAELKQALIGKDQVKAGTIRLIIAAIKDREIVARTQSAGEVEDSEIFKLMQGMVKQRTESKELYEKAGRHDLASKEASEIDVINAFLPQQMTAQEVEAAIDAIFEQLNPQSMKDMGLVMAELRTHYAGRMDFSKASALIKAKLTP